MDVRTVQENGGMLFVYLPREAMDGLKLVKGDNVVVVLNDKEKRIEIYTEDSIRKRAGI